MQLTFEVLAGDYAVSRLPAHVPSPKWVNGSFTSVSRSPDELSIVCEQQYVPDEVHSERNWACLRVAGTMDFSMVGVVASLATTIANASLGIFVVSTFNTDYVLVKRSDFEAAVVALRRAGHEVLE